MANKKISQLPSYTGTADDFLIPGVDPTNLDSRKADLGDLIDNKITEASGANGTLATKSEVNNQNKEIVGVRQEAVVVRTDIGSIVGNTSTKVKICDANIKTGEAFRFRLTADEGGTLGRIMIVRNRQYGDGTPAVQDYCQLGTWYEKTADVDIYEFDYLTGNSPNLSNVVFELDINSLETRVSQNETDIAANTASIGNNTNNIAAISTNQTKLEDKALVTSTNIGTITGAVTSAVKIRDVDIKTGDTFRFRILGSGTVGRLVIECNHSYTPSTAVQDHCQLNTWYEVTAAIDMTELDYQTGTDGSTNLSDVVFELDINSLETRVSQNETDIAANTAGIDANATAISTNTTDIKSLEKKFILIANLFNPADCSYFDSWGSSSQSYHTTGYIDVSNHVGDTVYFSYNNGSTAWCRQMRLYDKDKANITKTITGVNNIDNITSYDINDSRIHYIRCVISPSYLDKNNATKKFQIECNNRGIHPYMEYGVGTVYLRNRHIDTDFIGGLIAGGDTNVAKVTSKLYLTNKRTDLFFSPMYHNWQNLINRFCRVTASGSDIYRQFRNMVTIDASANGTLTFKTYDNQFNEIGSSDVETVFTPQAQTGNIRCLFMGSSISSHGIYENRLKTLCGDGFEAVGTRHARAFSNIYFEAVGGWGLGTYYSYRKVKTNATSPFWHPSNGRYWGVVGFWKDVMTYNEYDSANNPNDYVMSGRRATAEAAGFDANNGYITNDNGRLETNDIMYDDALGYFVQWNGSAWVQIAEPSTWGWDFVKYGNMWDIAAPDLFVMSELSPNDFRGRSTTPDFTTWNTQAEAMFTALKLWKNDIHIAMIIPISTFGGDFSKGEFVQRGNYRMYQSRLNQIANFDGREDENIYLIDDAIFFDEMYGYPLSTDADVVKPNQEYTGDETLRVQINSPHPTEQGEYLLADGMYGIVQYVRGVINT